MNELAELRFKDYKKNQQKITVLITSWEMFCSLPFMFENCEIEVKIPLLDEVLYRIGYSGSMTTSGMSNSNTPEQCMERFVHKVICASKYFGVNPAHFNKCFFNYIYAGANGNKPLSDHPTIKEMNDALQKTLKEKN
jgi:hypothetical protein